MLITEHIGSKMKCIGVIKMESWFQKINTFSIKIEIVTPLLKKIIVWLFKRRLCVTLNIYDWMYSLCTTRLHLHVTWRGWNQPEESVTNVVSQWVKGTLFILLFMPHSQFSVIIKHSSYYKLRLPVFSTNFQSSQNIQLCP